jgi:hypothetical protein
MFVAARRAGAEVGPRFAQEGEDAAASLELLDGAAAEAEARAAAPTTESARARRRGVVNERARAEKSQRNTQEVGWSMVGGSGTVEEHVGDGAQR